MDPAILVPPLDQEERRRAVAGFLLHAQLAGRQLPEHLGDIPDRMLVDRLARMDAKELLASLLELFGIEWWNRDTFVRAFVEGALKGWRPGTLVQETPSRLRVVSRACPIAAEVERDPRLCEACQDLQKHAAYLALIGQVESVAFEQLMSKGDGVCELNIRFREGSR